MRELYKNLKGSLAFRTTLTLMVVQTIPLIVLLVFVTEFQRPQEIAETDYGILAAEATFLEKKGLSNTETLFFQRYFNQKKGLEDREVISGARANANIIWDHLKADNPNLWYVFKTPELEEAYGSPAVYKDKAYQYIRSAATDVDGCTSARFYFSARGSDAVAFIRECDGHVFYTEFGGLSNGLTRSPKLFISFPLANHDKDFLFQALVLLMIFCVTPIVIYLHTRPIRHAAFAAERIGYASSNQKLPADGIFTEIKGFIDSINTGLSRIDAASRREKYFRDAIAHELRTPLTLLRVGLDDVSDLALRKTLTEDLNGTVKLLDRILVFSKTASGRYSEELVNIVELVREACASCGAFAIDSDIELDFSYADGARANYRTNRTVVFLILVNLINNAIKHSGTKSPIEIKLKTNGVIAIKDYGIGMDATHLSILNGETNFELHNSSRRGDGIGLLIVSELIKYSGISVLAQNSPNGGTFIELTL